MFEVVHPEPSLQASVVEAAHKYNMLTIAHATTLEDTATILDAGVDGLAHTFCDRAITADLISKYKVNNAFCIPTLTVACSFTGQDTDIAARFTNDKRVAGLVSEEQKQNMRDSLGMAAKTSKVEYAYDSVRQLKAAGVDILW